MRYLVAMALAAALIWVALPADAQQATPVAPSGLAAGMLQRGASAAEAGDFDRAILDFSFYILVNPKDARGYYLRGLSYLGVDDADTALDDFALALRYSEQVPELQVSILASRSEIFARRGDGDAAIGDLDALIAIRPSVDAFMQRGVLQLAGASFEEAIADFDEAIDRSTDSQPVLYFYRGFAQDALNNRAAAASDYLEWVVGIGERTTDEGPLASGDAVVLQMAQSLVYRIAFDAKRGDEINLLARNVGGDIDPLLVILAPDGTPLVANDDALFGRDTTAVVIGFEAPSSGSYHALVTHSISGYNGRVQVMLETR